MQQGRAALLWLLLPLAALAFVAPDRRRRPPLAAPAAPSASVLPPAAPAHAAAAPADPSTGTPPTTQPARRKRADIHPLVLAYLDQEREQAERFLDYQERITFHVYKRRRPRWRKPRRSLVRYMLAKHVYDPVQPILEQKMEQLKKKFGHLSELANIPDDRLIEFDAPAPRWPNRYLAYSRQLPEGYDQRQRMLWYHAQWHQRFRLDPLAQAGAFWEYRFTGFESFDTEAHFTCFGGFTFQDVKRAFETAPLVREKIMTPPQFFKLEPMEVDFFCQEPISVVGFFAVFNDSDAVSSKLHRQHLRYHRLHKKVVEYYDLYDVPSIEYEEAMIKDVVAARHTINFTIPHRTIIEEELFKKFWSVCELQYWTAIRTNPPEVEVDVNKTDPALLAAPKRRGVLILFNADTHAKAREYMNNDPFMQFGVYARDSIQIGDADEFAMDRVSIQQDTTSTPKPGTRPNSPPKPEDILLNELPPLDSIPFHHDMNMEAARRYLQFMKRSDFIRYHLFTTYLFKKMTYNRYKRMPPRVRPITSKIIDFTAGSDTLERGLKRLALDNIRRIPKKDAPRHVWDEPIVDDD